MTKLFTIGSKKEEIVNEDSLNPFTNVQVENTNADKLDDFSNSETKQETTINSEFVSGNIEQPNFANVETTIVDNENKGEYTWVDNTGKTGEDIKNPIYNNKLEDSDKKVSGNFFICFLVFIQTLIFPGSSVIKNTEKYVEGKKAIKVSVSIIIYIVLFSFVGRIIGGCFVEKYIALKRDYGYVLDFGNLGNIDTLSLVLCAAIIPISLILVLAAVNYASSFVRNKSLSFGAYLLVNSLAIIPFILGFNVILPVLSVLSKNIAIFLFILSFIYSLIIYLNAIDYLMEFSTYNRKVFYLLLNYTVVLVIIFLLISLFFEGELQTLLDLIM